MKRKSISFMLIFSLLWYCGCADSSRAIVTTQYLDPADNILALVLIDGRTIDFEGWDGYYEPQSKRYYSAFSNNNSINADSVSYLIVERKTVNAGMTVLAVVGILALTGAALFVIALLTKQSCPFVYSYNGEAYEFDAEPLGGAICKGLERTEYSRLDCLRPDDGRYSLLVRNEVDETQFIDAMNIVVVDHPENTTVTPSLDGMFYQSAAPVPPSRAWDKNGTNLLPFIEKVDHVYWQTHLTGDTAALLIDNPYEELTFVFPKPAGSSSAEILLSIGTSHWGSNMIRKNMELYGSWSETALQALNASEETRQQMLARIVRDRTLMMNVEVLHPDGWKPQTLVHGCGPLIIEDRAYHVDLSGTVGDSVILRFRPAIGYWTLDYIALDYQSERATNVRVLPLASAITSTGLDRTAALATLDEVYYEMPEIGDEATLTFDELPRTPGMARSYFLKTTGYYHLHLKNSGAMDATLLNEFSDTPGAIVRYAMREFVKWKRDPADFSKRIQTR